MKSLAHINILKTLGYDFRLNTLTLDTEVNGEPLSKGLYAQIRTKLRDLGHARQLAAFEDSWEAHAFENGYNPIRDYLYSLPSYTEHGQPYLIPELASHFQDVDGIFSTWLIKWLVGAVGKVVNAGHTTPVQNPMLVLVGPQNLGKSQFVRWLCSGLPSHFIESQINVDDKDTWIRLGSYFIWEVAELQSIFRRQDREALKDFITRDKIITRKAYGRFDVHLNAVASLIGTVNENGTGFLNDPTGNRRFLTCELTNIDWAYTRLDPNKIWSEAWHFFNTRPGFWQLSIDEVKKRDEINLRFQEDDPIEDLILKWYEITGSTADFVSSVDIREFLELQGLRGTTRGNSMAIATALKNLKAMKVNGPPRGFRGIRRRGVMP